ncbi:hypothetical protein NC651_025947 [Populus alba x Populus x berolinensis]|nr:hypothetical protein NC651_025947 [Populus alba x Populus x berolinensis]
MATYNLALIIGNPLNNAEFLLAKQTPPPKFGIEEYDSFVDSDLWDLPSKKLDLVEGELEPGSFVIEGLERTSLRKFDFDSAINKEICKFNFVLEQVGFKANDGGEWRFLKHLEEAEFGPGLPVHTVYISGKLLNRNRNLPEKVNTALDYQEYPPGVIIVPMRSRTAKPFHTTNLVVFAPESVKNKCEDYNFVAHGDALIVDPGCRANFHKELLKVVAPLSKKLVVFVTHHHRDHVDGLSVIQKCNPNATLLAHKNSMRRIGKGDWSLNHISVSGGEDICIGGQRLNIIFAPGHTDGHLALLHVDTHSLIVGDHCVGIRIPNASMGLLQSRKCPLGHYFWWKYDSFENRGFSAINMGRLIFEKIRDMYLEGLRLKIAHLVQEWGWNRAEPLSFSEPSTSLVENRNCCRSILFELLDYFQSTYKFIELAPHVLIPMHGRVNLWPKRMLCGYLKNRRSRELSILEAIENGAKTLIDIVANIYSEVDRSLWLPASSNVRLHVEHLAQQNKLPKQNPPPKFGIEEYDTFVDSDLWDLPSTKLDLEEGELESGSIVIEGLERTDLGKFDVESAIGKVLELAGFKVNDGGEWRFLKLVEEAEFGPGLPVHRVYIVGKLLPGNQNLPELCKWMSIQSCLSLLVDVEKSSDRVGPLVVLGLINDSAQSSEKVNTALHYQEYPPGVIIVPMKTHGDALIVDPGCRADFHEELLKIVAALSKKLVVFVTHHHGDHVDGLSVIQKCNPDATLLAHENTMCRIRKDDWSLGHISVSGGEDICIGGQRLNIIFAPGHTDGHLALLHVETHSLIVGDHCVGQGSALLDIASGGNMADYFRSTYKFIELAPHVLIPMHGRVNLWPKHMLCGYLKNRRSRELSILEAIENGAKTLFDIVADVYSGVDRGLWYHAASNVRLHVNHLNQQNKLPKGFSVDTFNCSLIAFAEKVGKIEPK